MTVDEIPQELIDILNKHANREHNRNGRVITVLAEILTQYEKLRKK